MPDEDECSEPRPKVPLLGTHPRVLRAHMPRETRGSSYTAALLREKPGTTRLLFGRAQMNWNVLTMENFPAPRVNKPDVHVSPRTCHQVTPHKSHVQPKLFT